ncbi:MAG: type II toxin-antitoxin system HicB family antitoxin [Pseudomonadota bacterium]
MKKNNNLSYKGFYGLISFDQQEKIFYGKVEFIKDLANYEATDAETLISSFKDAVDCYLQDCKDANREPDIPFKGSFNVRIGTDLHEKAGLYALQHEDSLNNVVKNALTKFLTQNTGR